MAKDKTPERDDEAQSQRFIEAARQIEVDGGLAAGEADKAFDALTKKVLPPKN